MLLISTSSKHINIQIYHQHAGVANGGHYYSFARDPDSLEWCRLDDDDVSPFDPDGLPYQVRITYIFECKYEKHIYIRYTYIAYSI